MDVNLENLDEKLRFDVKLQISLYNTAVKVMDPTREEEFRVYMEERKEKIKKLLGCEEVVRIFENGELIFEG